MDVSPAEASSPGPALQVLLRRMDLGSAGSTGPLSEAHATESLHADKSVQHNSTTGSSFPEKLCRGRGYVDAVALDGGGVNQPRPSSDPTGGTDRRGTR
ncbi:unnamed protein product [Rangifer tarandus platyrhynchus]|uniref:Uncharacterized protein n=1 Tax=Rangifer tarandus platyrhynchus TaxID=3082113 RepID=A0AC59Y4S6_RANTA